MTSPDGALAVAGVAGAADATGLAAHAAALQTLLTDLSTLTVSQLVALFRQYQNTPNFPQLLKSALPQIVLPHAHAAATVTAQWYNELNPTSSFTATPTVTLPADQLDKTVNWALHAPGTATPLDRLAGSTKRMVFDASRDTVTGNAAKQRIKYARYASANACAFCQLLAARGAVYKSEDSAGVGHKFHDHDRCVVVAVPEGQTYTPPDYVDQWSQDYKNAVKATKAAGQTKGKHGAIDFKAVLAHMRSNTDAH